MKNMFQPNEIKRMLRKIFVSICILFLLKSFSAAASEFSPLNPSKSPNDVTTSTYTLKELGGDAMILNGYQPVYTFYLPLAQSLHPQKVILHLKVKFSPLLNDETRLDIKFNQTLLSRVSLPADTSQELNLDIDVPLNHLLNDWQAFDFNAFFFGNSNLCNPNLWIYVSPQSSITTTTLNKPLRQH